MKIFEHDIIFLTEDFKDLKKGTEGTVVHLNIINNKVVSFEVEFKIVDETIVETIDISIVKKKLKHSRNVESYFCKLLPNGTYMLTFNTNNRWIDYHCYSDYEFLFGEEKEGNIQQVYEFLPEIDGHYLQSTLQDKDQITVFYTPYYKEYIKESKKIEV
jgi:hypothetical protein